MTDLSTAKHYSGAAPQASPQQKENTMTSKKCMLLTAVATVLALSSPAAAWAAAPGQLDSGARLGSGATLFSPGGSHALTMQTDGNLVLYAPGQRAIWSSGTAGQRGAILAEQTDGNLVVIAPGNRPVWSSGTAGRPGTVLQVQDDGNAVQYAPGHVAIWSTRSGGTGGGAGTDRIAALATANQGKMYCNVNTLGGRGYYTSCKPEHWCADFAKWVWVNSGLKADGLDAGAISFYRYGKKFQTLRSRPSTGDAIVYNINRDGTSAVHVGLVVSTGNGVIRTENGNFGGKGTGAAFDTSSSVKPADLPANATIGSYVPQAGLTISAIVSPVR
jgi:hypothetical protein